MWDSLFYYKAPTDTIIIVINEINIRYSTLNEEIIFYHLCVLNFVVLTVMQIIQRNIKM